MGIQHAHKSRTLTGKILETQQGNSRELSGAHGSLDLLPIADSG